jgi:hypothetical protein
VAKNEAKARFLKNRGYPRDSIMKCVENYIDDGFKKDIEPSHQF